MNHSAGKYVDGSAHTNTIESVWNSLKKSIVGIYHSVSVKHLQRYVNETVFRLNEGRCEVKTMDRINALIAKTFGVVTRYKVLIGTHVFEKDLIAQMFSKSCDCAVTYSENLLVRKAA